MLSISQPNNIVVAVRQKIPNSVWMSVMPDSIPIWTRISDADTARKGGHYLQRTSQRSNA